MGAIRRRLLVLGAGVALAAAPLLAAGPARAGLPPMPGSSPAPSCDWPMFGHDLGRSFAGCTSITNVTAPTLHPKWRVDTGSPVTAQPVVANGTVYVGSAAGTFYAIDAASGAIKWTHQVADTSTNDYGKVVDSAAVANVGGTDVVAFGGGATLYVLDAGSGALLAAQCVDPSPTRNADPRVPCGPTSNTTEIESSPAIVPMPDGTTRIVVGMDFNETSNIGQAGLLGFDLSNTGGSWQLTPLWKYDPETRTTYTSDPIHYGGATGGKACGDVWSSPTIAGNLAVFGVGNCDYDNVGTPPVTESVTAVALDSGALQWTYQPRDPQSASQLDLDFGATPNLLPNGHVGEGGKDGSYYSFTPGGALDTPNFPSHLATGSSIGGMIGSSAIGKVNGKDAVFASTAIPVHPGQPDQSFQENLQTPGHATGLHAIDAVTGAKLWDAPAAPAYGAAVYAGGVVFVPDTFSFQLQGYDANTGAPLWTFPMGGPPASPPAVVGNSLYAGTGVSFGDPLNEVGAIWGFQTAP